MRISQIISQKTVNALVKDQSIHAEDAVHYLYAFEYLLDIILYTGSLLVIGILTHHFTDTVLFITIMLPLRMVAGGAHAPTRILCSIVSYGIYIVVVFLLDLPLFTIHVSVLFMIYFALSVIILSLCPVVNPENKLLLKHKSNLKRFCFCYLCFLNIVFLILLFKHTVQIMLLCHIIILINQIIGVKIYANNNEI